LDLLAKQITSANTSKAPVIKELHIKFEPGGKGISILRNQFSSALKLLMAMRVMQRGAARALFTRTQLIFGAMAWDACVLAVYGVLALILPAILARRYFLLLVAMLVVPFVRLVAAPLAVAGNRHR